MRSLVLVGLVGCGSVTEDGPVEVLRVEEGFQAGATGDCVTPDLRFVEAGRSTDALFAAIGEAPSDALLPADDEALAAVWIGGCTETGIHLDPADIRMESGVLQLALSRRQDAAVALIDGGPWVLLYLPDIQARRAEVEVFTPRTDTF